MESVARLNRIHLSPLKARMIANHVRGLPVEKALTLLKYMPQKGSGLIKKVIESALSNAENNHGMDIDTLKVSVIYVNQAGAYRRMMARAKGRGSSVLKRLSHIYVKLEPL